MSNDEEVIDPEFDTEADKTPYTYAIDKRMLEEIRGLLRRSQTLTDCLDEMRDALAVAYNLPRSPLASQLEFMVARVQKLQERNQQEKEEQ